MTDYELLSTFMEGIASMWGVFATYVSIIFAFLVASYIASSKLRPAIVSIVITLFTLVALWATWALNRGSVSAMAVVKEVKRGVQDGTSSLGWHPITGMPDSLLDIIPVIVTSVALLAYFGSLVFFFYQRKHPAD